VAPNEIAHELTKLEGQLKQLEAEYTMFFAGRSPKPPWETRARVDALVKHYDRAHIPNTGDRYRFTTLQARYTALVGLWDRGLRAREEGRPGPFAPRRVEKPREAEASPRPPRVVAFTDPLREVEKLHDLHDALSAARREVGAEPVPFQKFAELIQKEVGRLQPAGGEGEVAFRVTVKSGKVSLTARAMKGTKSL